MPRAPLLLLALMPACVVLDKLGADTGGGDGSSKFLTSTDSLSVSPTGDLSVDVPSGVTAFQLTAFGSNLVDVEQLVDPDGNTAWDEADWYNKDYWLTEAVYPIASDTTFNWPVRAEDEALSSGSWTVTLGSYNARGRGQDDDLSVDLAMKKDADFSAGTLKVRLVYAKGVDDDADVVTAVKAAVEIWRTIYATYGITLDEEYASSDIDPTLTSPAATTDYIGTVSADTDGRQVTLVIGETISDCSDCYAVTGAIPDSLFSTNRSGIAVSWLANAGSDGAFSTGDIRLFGETMAHETGHFLGEFHPVNMSYTSPYDALDWDALDDTDECSKESTCATVLGDNLMYPWPECTRSTCTPQETLTDMQVGVAHRYTGIN